MKIIKHLKQITFLLAILGLIASLFLWAQIAILGAQRNGSNVNTISFNVGGTNIFEDVALRYCFISASFLLYIAFLLVRNKIFMKMISLVPLTFIIVQCRLLIIFKTEVLKGTWLYLNWLEITYYIDFGFLALAVLLLILQIYLIGSIYRSSIYANSFGNHRSESGKWRA